MTPADVEIVSMDLEDARREIARLRALLTVPPACTPHLDRPLVSFDVETTGVDPENDRIIQFAAVVLSPDGSRRQWESLFNPGISIPSDATEVNHITDDMVKDAPPFSDKAGLIARSLAGKDFLTYNGRRFDLPILDAEMRRAGIRLDTAGVRIIDSFAIFRNKEPRDLTACVKKYTGHDHTGAHGALADSEWTMNSLLGQLGYHDDLRAMSLDELMKFCDGDNTPCDLAGKLYRSADGLMRYAFGKSKDKPVKDEPGFGRWMLGCTTPAFPGSTREVLLTELRSLGLL